MSRRWNEAGRKTSATSVDLEQRRTLRELRRRSLIADALSELGDRATHEAVARRTGIPVGYLEWFFACGNAESRLLPDPTRDDRTRVSSG